MRGMLSNHQRKQLALLWTGPERTCQGIHWFFGVLQALPRTTWLQVKSRAGSLGSVRQGRRPPSKHQGLATTSFLLPLQLAKRWGNLHQTLVSVAALHNSHSQMFRPMKDSRAQGPSTLPNARLNQALLKAASDFLLHGEKLRALEQKALLINQKTRHRYLSRDNCKSGSHTRGRIDQGEFA